MKLLSKLLLLAVFATAAVSCSSDDDLPPVTPPEGEQPAPNLVEAAEAAGLDVLLEAVGAVEGLGETLLAQDAITVFAPTDEAFGAALQEFEVETLDELVEAIGGVENLEIVLGFHVVPAVAFSDDLAEGDTTFQTLAEQEITVTRTGDAVTVTGWDDVARNVVTADVEIENGVVHVINGVLIPELDLPEDDGEDDAPTLVEAAEAAGLDLLLQAVGAVDGLAETLLGAEAITVFAPTDDAFGDALEEFEVETLEELIEEIGGVGNLETVLGFHVVPAVAFSEDLEEGEQTFPTLAGDQEITVTRTGSGVTVTDAAGNTYNVTTPDVEIENGVVHVIDGVLLPELAEEANVVSMTVGNDGASAYFVSEINGDEEVTELNTNNSTWTLSVGTRYELTVTGGGPHPFEIRDAAGNALLSMSADGSFEGDADVDFQNSDDQEFSFTLTQELADEIADYICTVHGAMNGNIVVQ